MKILISISLWGIFILPVFAQEGMVNYKQAISLLEEGDNETAMELLRPYMDKEKYGPLSDYSKYHFARAAYGNGQFELARNVLNGLLEGGQWGKTEEARYLLALTHFQQSNPSDALMEISQLSSGDIKKEAYRATYEFLNVSSVSVLMLQFNQYTDNLGLALALKENLEMQSSLSSSEQEVYDQVKNMAFSDEQVVYERQIDEVLDIAIVLPFNYDGGTGINGLSENNFVVQLYQGIKMGLDEAKRQGVELNVRTFDTERSENTILGILNDPFLKKADLIIGPIYPEETGEVAKYAERYKIPHINPLSNVHDNISGFDFSYLFRPSINSIAEKVVDYCRRFEGRKLAVAYSGTTRDETLAKTFVENARRSGFQIVLDQQVTAKSMRKFFKDIALDGQANPKVDMMVIFSDDPNVASPTFAMVESLGSGIPVIVMDSWLYFNFASYEMMEIQDFHFIGNNTVDFNREELKDFRGDFLDVYRNYPSLNAYVGYELAIWVTDIINPDKGFNFQENLNRQGFYDGVLTFGFDFEQVRYNNFVPILRLENGTLEIE